MTDYCPEGIPDTPLGRYVRLIKPFESANTRPETRFCKKHTKEEKEHALKLHTGGMPIDEVARITGLPLTTVKTWARKAGVFKSTRKTHDPEFRDKIVERMRNGEGVRALERETGLSRGTIQFWRKYL